MKSLRKLFTMLLIAALTFAFCLPAFAEGTGSITVNGTVPGKTYEIYKIFDLAQNESGTGVTYSIDEDWIGFFFNGSAKTEAGETYLLDAQPEGGSLSQIIFNGQTYYMNITESNVTGFAADAMGYALNIDPDGSIEAVSSTTVFDDIELGYYLVLPVNATEGSYGSICSLTNAAPNGEIHMKGEYPTIDKEVDDQDVEVGQEVTWTITSTVPDTTGYDTFIWKLHDTMSEGLTFGSSIETTNFTVMFGETEITISEDDIIFADNGFVLTLDMTEYQDYAGQPITITYTAIVNENAVCNYTHNLAWLEYGHDPDEELEHTPPIEIPVYSSEIVIDKIEAGNESIKLEGAKFVLYKEVEGVRYYYKYTPASEGIDAKVEWIPSSDGSVPADATVVVTDVNGYAAFQGLESGTYYIQETEAPEGYNLLTNPVEIIVDAPTTDENGKPIGVSVESQIANNTGSELPETGGIGTKIFYIVGAVLLLGAGITLAVRRRAAREQ